MFSGCGGSSQGIELAGFDVWYAANHWEYAVELHEANHPKAEHFVADLLDKEAPDYYHPELLPRADFLWASPSCTNHSQSNARRAYQQNLNLFDSVLEDPDYDEMVTESEKSRATAVCVLQYARYHRPLAIAVENVVAFAQWGRRVGNTKRGDGTTFDWWIKELENLGYRVQVLYLNSMFFGVPQSRDRMYVCASLKSTPAPDLDFTPLAHCDRCDTDVLASQTWKRPTRAWPRPQWGKYGTQYVYTCRSCRSVVTPYAAAAWEAIDWSNLGRRIGDPDTDLVDATLQRLDRGRLQYFGGGRRVPFVAPCKSVHGVDRLVTEPLPTQTTQQERMVVSPPAFQAVLAGNTYEREGSTCRVRGVDEPMPTQQTSETNGVVFHPMLHTARGSHEGRTPVLLPLTEPMTSVTAGGNHHFLLSAVWSKINGGPASTAWHPVDDGPLGTLMPVDTTCLLSPPEGMPLPALEDCRYRLLTPPEIQTGMGFPRSFHMFGSNRNKVRALGNAVTPPVATWIAGQMLAPLRGAFTPPPTTPTPPVDTYASNDDLQAAA
jgi:site-specific DNA-cytosine methylase